MSNFTKVLIVLLTISAIFLCGIVVTYVANADNYKQRYDKQQSNVRSLEEEKDSLTKQFNEKTQQKDDLEKSLNTQIATMKTRVDELTTKVSTLERENKDLDEKSQTFASVTKAFTDTAEKQTQTLNAALEEVKQLKAEQIKMSKQLEETSMALTEKTAIAESLNAEKKRLTEEKADLQTRYDKLLQGGGRVAASMPVTAEKGSAIAAQPASATSALKAQVVEVDPKNTMATISIGSADGVKDGMKFHVTRGDNFICDILIIDVDTDKAVGVLELVQQPPKIGDTASTNL